MKHIPIRFFISLMLWVAVAFPAAAQEDSNFQTAAKQAIVMDYETGAVLLEKNADERMPTSSMSKVLTMYQVFDGLKSGKIALDSEFIASEKAWRMGGSKMFVDVDKAVKVEDLIRGVIVQSGNDATVVLAEGLAGSEEAFSDMLNETAKRLGMENSHFMNASGWPDPDHYSTARDLAIMTRALIHDFPEYYGYYSEIDFTYNGIKQGNRNPLLYRNIGADGVKTGHTEDAGYGLIGSGIYEGRRVIFVMNGLESMQQRAEEGAKLLEYGLRRFENKKLFVAGQEVTKLPVALGVQDSVAAVTLQDAVVTLPRVGQANIKVYADVTTPLKAPVRKGDAVGTLNVEIPGHPALQYPLVAGADVAEKGFFEKAVSRVGALFGS